MAEKPTPYQDLSWIKNDGISLPIQSQPADGMGRWEYYLGTFKQAISNQGVAGNPFSYAKKGGSNYFQDTATFGTNARLKLVNESSTQSGYVTFTMASGWQGLFYIKTGNDDFFEDNVQENWVSDRWNEDDPFVEELGEAVNLLEDEGWPSVWVDDEAEVSDSRAITGLDSGDYISFDVDGESSNAAQARIRIGGDDYLSNVEPDADVWITCVYLRYWNSDFNWLEKICPPGYELIDGQCVEIEDDDDNPPPPNDDCPAGYEKNDFGICVLITPPSPEECEEGFIWDPDTASCVPIIRPEDDITGAEMAAVIAAVAGVIFLAIKVV